MYSQKVTISKGKAYNQNLLKRFICKKVMKIYFKAFMDYLVGKSTIPNY